MAVVDDGRAAGGDLDAVVSEAGVVFGGIELLREGRREEEGGTLYLRYQEVVLITKIHYTHVGQVGICNCSHIVVY